LAQPQPQLQHQNNLHCNSNGGRVTIIIGLTQLLPHNCDQTAVSDQQLLTNQHEEQQHQEKRRMQEDINPIKQKQVLNN